MTTDSSPAGLSGRGDHGVRHIDGFTAPGIYDGANAVCRGVRIAHRDRISVLVDIFGEERKLHELRPMGIALEVVNAARLAHDHR